MIPPGAASATVSVPTAVLAGPAPSAIISFAVFDETVTEESEPPDGTFETDQPSVHEAVQRMVTVNRTSISSTFPSWSVSSIFTELTAPEKAATVVLVMATLLQRLLAALFRLSPAKEAYHQ